MEYTTRMVTSTEGLSQEDALISLQEHPEFKSGTRVASIYNQGGRWVAKLLEPKTAAEAFEDIEETPADLHKEKHEEMESPFVEAEEHDENEEHEEKHEQTEEKKIKELEKKIDLLLDALGISEKGEEPSVPEAPKAPAADQPAAPAPKGGPSKSEPLPPGSGAKLKPGEVPNKPGITPVGAPSFASVRQAKCEGCCDEGTCENCDKHKKEATSVPPNAVNMNPDGGTPTATGPTQSPCSKCGGTDPKCTQCSGAKLTSFTASKLDPSREITIRQAKASLENTFSGYKVARIQRDGEQIHARMERVAGPRLDAFKDKVRGVEAPAATNPVTRGQAQDENAAYQEQFDQNLTDQAAARQKAIKKVDPMYSMDPLNQTWENQKDQEFINENHQLPYPGADEYPDSYFQ